MGSVLSSAAAAAAGEDRVCLAPVRGVPRPRTKEERDLHLTSRYVYMALDHYNSNNPGAEFDPVEPIEKKAACVGFRQDFWYHVGFLARRREDNAPVQHFFAELRLDLRSHLLIVETCTILDKPLRSYRSRCAFCPDKFEILHPSDAEFVCGKKGHRKKFFRARNILRVPFP